MNIMPQDLSLTVLRASLFLMVSSGLVYALLSWTRTRSALVHRLAWSLVLAQGLIISPWCIELPWLPAAAPTSQLGWAVADASDHEPKRFDSEHKEVGGLSLPTDNATPGRHNAGIPSRLRPSAAPSPSTASLWPEAPSDLISGASPWMTWLTRCWLSGLLCCVAVSGLRYLWLLRLMQDSDRAPESWQRTWRRLLRQHDIEHDIPLRVHDRAGPLLCRVPGGYRVLVPVELWESLSPAEHIAVLRHELAHYQRGDVWKSLFARLAAVPHWFNPAAWWAVKKFDEAAEWACDERLAATAPGQVSSYARVLLRLVETDAPRVGMSAAGGASLAQRIRRLLAKTPRRESLFGRISLGISLIALMVFGSLRFDLVQQQANAQTQGNTPLAVVGDDPDDEFRRRLASFAKQLVTGDDALAHEFKQQLLTDPGTLVARDRIGWIEEEMRSKARSRAIPTFLERHFARSDSNGEYTYQVRDKEFSDTLLEACRYYQQDIHQIRPVLQDFADRVVEDSEENKLLKRFLQHEAAAVMLYVRQLRGQLRPDATTVQRRLDEFFVPVGDQFVLRAGNREESEEVLRVIRRAQRGHALIKDELVEFAKELAESDQPTRRLKKAMIGPELQSIAAFRIAEDDHPAIGQRVDEFFDQLEHITIDTSEGLVVNRQEYDEVAEILDQADRVKAAAEKLRRPLQQFAARIPAKDEAHRGWKEFLQSDLALMRLADDYEVSSADPETAVQALLSEGLETDAQDRVRLRAEVTEEFVELARDLLREFRTIRRKGRSVDEFARHVSDSELKSALQSMTGKLVIAQAIEQEYAGRRFDGLRVWIDEHFDRTPDGFVMKDDHQSEFRDFLEHIQEVEAELANDDF